MEETSSKYVDYKWNNYPMGWCEQVQNTLGHDIKGIKTLQSVQAMGLNILIHDN